MAEPAAAGTPGRGPGHPLLGRRSGWLLLAGVALAHLVAVGELAGDRYGWGAGERPSARIEVAFVRELLQATPPAAPPRPEPTARPQRALPSVATRAASAPQAAPVAAPVAPPVVPREDHATPATEPPLAADAAPPVERRDDVRVPAVADDAPAAPAEPTPASAAAEPASAAPAVAATALPAAASQAGAEPFDWPPSTELNYTLNGYYRGPIEGGTAQVAWLRGGTRYQVQMETSLGPMLSRRIVSEGELTDRGLVPRRFDGEQKVLFRSPRRWSLRFAPERITLSDGREAPSPPGVQDEASQFVQLTWLFTTQPALLEPGRSVEVPLALTRRVDRWIYDVKERQTLQLPFGSVETVYVKPRREARGGDLTAEIWFAPTLQYLPVRILIRQDESSFIDLLLERPPLQAAPVVTR